MGKNKLRKFAENETFKNMVQAPRTDLLEKGLHLKGKWHKDFFKNDRPIVLELGCRRIYGRFRKAISGEKLYWYRY